MTSASTINNTPCLSHEPGHVLSPELLAATRENPAAWVPALVIPPGPGRPVRIRTRTDTGDFVCHDQLSLVELLILERGRRARTIWHPGSGILGVLANPRAAAGNRYFSLTGGPLGSCTLHHDASLAAAFEVLALAFELPAYERNTGSSA